MRLAACNSVVLPMRTFLFLLFCLHGCKPSIPKDIQNVEVSPRSDPSAPSTPPVLSSRRTSSTEALTIPPKGDRNSAPNDDIWKQGEPVHSCGPGKENSEECITSPKNSRGPALVQTKAATGSCVYGEYGEWGECMPIRCSKNEKVGRRMRERTVSDPECDEFLDYGSCTDFSSVPCEFGPQCTAPGMLSWQSTMCHQVWVGGRSRYEATDNAFAEFLSDFILRVGNDDVIPPVLSEPSPYINDCIIKDMRPDGTVYGSEQDDILSPWDCQTLCEIEHDYCVAFRYINQKCELLSEIFEVYDERNYYYGERMCCERYARGGWSECIVEDGMRYRSIHSDTASVVKAQCPEKETSACAKRENYGPLCFPSHEDTECWKICQEVWNANSFEFLKTKPDPHAEHAEAYTKATPNNKACAGKKWEVRMEPNHDGDPTRGGCLKENIAFEFSSSLLVVGSYFAEDCQIACVLTAECMYIEFDDVKKSCTLLNSAGGEKSMEGVYSGDPECYKGPACELSSDPCYEACVKSYLLNRFAIAQAAGLHDVWEIYWGQLGPPDCPETYVASDTFLPEYPSCLIEDRFAGSELGNHMPIMSEFDCYHICSVDEQCLQFTFSINDRLCTLFDTLPSSAPLPGKYISGGALCCKEVVWTEWSDCDATCGRGIQIRKIDDSLYHDRGLCSEETRSCDAISFKCDYGPLCPEGGLETETNTCDTLCRGVWAEIEIEAMDEIHSSPYSVFTQAYSDAAIHHGCEELTFDRREEPEEEGEVTHGGCFLPTEQTGVISRMADTVSPKKCQDVCQMTQGCEAFIYTMEPTLTCYQLHGSGEEVETSVWYSGPAYCCNASDWSDWELCPVTCANHATRSRTRTAVGPDPNDHTPCAPVEDTEPCGDFWCDYGPVCEFSNQVGTCYPYCREVWAIREFECFEKYNPFDCWKPYYEERIGDMVCTDVFYPASEPQEDDDPLADGCFEDGKAFDHAAVSVIWGYLFVQSAKQCSYICLLNEECVMFAWKPYAKTIEPPPAPYPDDSIYNGNLEVPIGRQCILYSGVTEAMEGDAIVGPAECPAPAVVSDWTDWGECNQTCGDGKRFKTRYVIIPPVGGGEMPNLTQEERCRIAVCDTCAIYNGITSTDETVCCDPDQCETCSVENCNDLGDLEKLKCCPSYILNQQIKCHTTKSAPCSFITSATLRYKDNIYCSNEKVVTIISALFGPPHRLPNAPQSPEKPDPLCILKDVTSFIHADCGRSTSCEVITNVERFRPDMCPNETKSLYVVHACQSVQEQSEYVNLTGHKEPACENALTYETNVGTSKDYAEADAQCAELCGDNAGEYKLTPNYYISLAYKMKHTHNCYVPTTDYESCRLFEIGENDNLPGLQSCACPEGYVPCTKELGDLTELDWRAELGETCRVGVEFGDEGRTTLMDGSYGYFCTDESNYVLRKLPMDTVPICGGSGGYRHILCKANGKKFSNRGGITVMCHLAKSTISILDDIQCSIRCHTAKLQCEDDDWDCFSEQFDDPPTCDVPWQYTDTSSTGSKNTTPIIESGWLYSVSSEEPSIINFQSPNFASTPVVLLGSISTANENYVGVVVSNVSVSGFSVESLTTECNPESLFADELSYLVMSQGVFEVAPNSFMESAVRKHSANSSQTVTLSNSYEKGYSLFVNIYHDPDVIMERLICVINTKNEHSFSYELLPANGARASKVDVQVGILIYPNMEQPITIADSVFEIKEVSFTEGEGVQTNFSTEYINPPHIFGGTGLLRTYHSFLRHTLKSIMTRNLLIWKNDCESDPPLTYGIPVLSVSATEREQGLKHVGSHEADRQADCEQISIRFYGEGLLNKEECQLECNDMVNSCSIAPHLYDCFVGLARTEFLSSCMYTLRYADEDDADDVEQVELHPPDLEQRCIVLTPQDFGPGKYDMRSGACRCPFDFLVCDKRAVEAYRLSWLPALDLCTSDEPVFVSARLGVKTNLCDASSKEEMVWVQDEIDYNYPDQYCDSEAAGSTFCPLGSDSEPKGSNPTPPPIIQDCKLTEWSGWGACNVTCQDENHVPIQIRTRTQLQQSLNGGESCSALEQSKGCEDIQQCENVCRISSWQKWQGCDDPEHADSAIGHKVRYTLQFGPQCDGKQYEQTLPCADIDLDEGLTDPNEPDDCEFHDPSEWSGCSQKCRQDLNRQPTRVSLQAPTEDSSIHCKVKTELEACDSVPACSLEERETCILSYSVEVEGSWTDGEEGCLCGPPFEGVCTAEEAQISINTWSQGVNELCDMLKVEYEPSEEVCQSEYAMNNFRGTADSYSTIGLAKGETVHCPAFPQGFFTFATHIDINQEYCQNHSHIMQQFWVAQSGSPPPRCELGSIVEGGTWTKEECQKFCVDTYASVVHLENATDRFNDLISDTPYQANCLPEYGRLGGYAPILCKAPKSTCRVEWGEWGECLHRENLESWTRKRIKRVTRPSVFSTELCASSGLDNVEEEPCKEGGLRIIEPRVEKFGVDKFEVPLSLSGEGDKAQKEFELRDILAGGKSMDSIIDAIDDLDDVVGNAGETIEELLDEKHVARCNILNLGVAVIRQHRGHNTRYDTCQCPALTRPCSLAEIVYSFTGSSSASDLANLSRLCERFPELELLSHNFDAYLCVTHTFDLSFHPSNIMTSYEIDIACKDNVKYHHVFCTHPEEQEQNLFAGFILLGTGGASVAFSFGAAMAILASIALTIKSRELQSYLGLRSQDTRVTQFETRQTEEQGGIEDAGAEGEWEDMAPYNAAQGYYDDEDEDDDDEED